jgi:hypothetical protein
VRNLSVLLVIGCVWLGGLLVPTLVAPSAAVASNDLDGYQITETTEIVLDGNMVKIEDLPANTETIDVQIDAASRTVIRLVLRTVP